MSVLASTTAEGGIDPEDRPSVNLSTVVTEVDETIEAREFTAGEFAAFGTAAVGLSILDTFASSLSLAEEGSIIEAVAGNSGIADFYRDRKAGVQLTGDVAGAFIPGTIAIKAIQGGGRLAKGLNVANNPLLRRLFTNPNRQATLERLLKFKDIRLAKKGIVDQGLLQDAGRRVVALALKKQKTVDGFKESVAVELGILATMNSSDVIYPEDFELVDHLTLAAFGIGIGTIPGYLVARAITRRSADSVAKLGHAARNPENLPVTFRTSRPGARDNSITTLALSAESFREQVAIAQKAGDTKAVTRANSDLLTAENKIKDEIIAVRKDGIPGITQSMNRTPLTDVQLGVMQDALKADPNALAGVAFIGSIDEAGDIAKNLGKEIEKHGKIVTKSQEELGKLEFGLLGKSGDEELIKKIEKLTNKSQASQDRLKIIEDLQVNIVNSAGEAIPTSLYTKRFHDVAESARKITIQAATRAGDPKRFTAKGIVDPNGLRSGKALFSITEDGHLFIRTPSQGKPDRTNLTEIVSKGGNVEEATRRYPDGFASRVVNDLTRAYHLGESKGAGGTLGNSIGKELSQNSFDIISTWTGGSMNAMRRIANAPLDSPDGKAFAEIYEAFNPFREKMRELADAHDGTILLFRGETKKTGNQIATNDVQSFSPSFKSALGFGDDSSRVVIARRVPIEDIIVPGAGFKGEIEIITKGNDKRRFGSQVGDVINPHNFTDLQDFDRSVAFALMGRAAQEFKPGAGKKIRINLDDHWTRFDFVSEVLDIHGEKVLDDLILPKEWVGDVRTNIEWASIRSKFEEYNVLVNKSETGPLKGIGRTPEQIRYALNLPASRQSLRSDPGAVPIADPGFRPEAGPVEQLFAALRVQGDTDLSIAVPGGLEEFRQLAIKHSLFPDTAVTTDLTIPIIGNALKVQTKKKQLIPNITVVSHNTSVSDLTKKALWETALGRQLDVQTILAGSRETHNSQLVIQLFEEIVGTSVYEFAKQIQKINEGSRSGQGVFTTARFATRDNPTFAAANEINTIITKITDEFLDKKLYTQINEEASLHFGRDISHEQVFSRMRGNDAAEVSIGTFFAARRMNWSLETKAIENADGTFSFLLKQNKSNKDRWRNLFDTEMPEDGALMAIQIIKGGKSAAKTVSLTPEAYHGATAFRDIGLQLRNEQNVINKAVNRSQINLKDWWVPPKNFQRKEVAYIINPAEGENAVKRTIVGRSAEDVRRQKDTPEIKEFMAANSEFRIVDQDDVEKYYHLNQQAFFNLADPSDSLVQAGKKVKGTSAGVGIENGRIALDDAVESIRKQTQNVGKRTTALMFESQINYARQTNDAFKFENRLADQSIWELYTDTLMGTGVLQRKGWVGGSYRQLETIYDDTMLKVWEKTQGKGVIGAVTASIRSPERSFNKVKSELGEHLPYEDAVKFMQDQHGIKQPGSLRKHAAALNWFTSLLTLRLFEVAHPILNLSGVVVTMPGIINAMRKIPGESRDTWLARTRAFGTPVGGESEAMAFSATKIMTAAAGDLWTTAGKKDWADAAKRGYLNQQVAEIQRTIVAPSQSSGAAIAQRATDYASILSDKSEELARGIAHMAGLRMGRQLGIIEERELHFFAHQIANESIGDYRSNNRPGIFQGAVGLPLGLFQTYMWNYWQRLFSYVENRQMRALAVQTAMQGSVFGVKSLPGWDQFTDHFASTFDGSVNPNDAIYNRYGPDFADWLMNGTLSNIPKLFGEDGVSFYTRGDANFQRLPTLVTNVGELAQVQLARSTMNIVRSTVDQFFKDGQFSVERQAEIVSMWMVNRPIRGMIELATGVAVDKRGNVISNEVREGLGIAMRVIGVRPMMEQKLIEANFDNNNQQAAQRYLRNNLRDTLQAKVRGGSLDQGDIKEGLMSYLEQGGDPRRFGTFIRDVFITATRPKARLQFEKFLKGGDMDQVLRLYNAGVLDGTDQ